MFSIPDELSRQHQSVSIFGHYWAMDYLLVIITLVTPQGGLSLFGKVPRRATFDGEARANFGRGP